MFYSADEFSQMLYHVGFVAVSSKTVLGGTVGFHRAAKAKPTGISRSQSECGGSDSYQVTSSGMQSWAVRCAIQDQTFMLENMNDAFGSQVAVE
jgi:hypothetical protein